MKWLQGVEGNHLIPVRARTVRLGTIRVTLRLNTGTRRATLRATRGGIVRSVTFRLDGKRLRIDRKAPFNVTIRRAALKPGRHLLKAVATPRRGKSRSLTLRLTVASC